MREADIVIQESRDIIGMSQIKVEIELFFDPAIKGFHNWVICGSTPRDIERSML